MRNTPTNYKSLTRHRPNTKIPDYDFDVPKSRGWRQRTAHWIHANWKTHTIANHNHNKTQLPNRDFEIPTSRAFKVPKSRALRERTVEQMQTHYKANCCFQIPKTRLKTTQGLTFFPKHWCWSRCSFELHFAVTNKSLSSAKSSKEVGRRSSPEGGIQLNKKCGGGVPPRGASIE